MAVRASLFPCLPGDGMEMQKTAGLGSSDISLYDIDECSK